MRTVSILIGTCMLLALVLSILAQESELDPIMKQVGPANQALQKALMSGSTSDVSAQAERLRGLFRQAEDFFRSRNITDAEGWAHDASHAAADAAKAAKANDMGTAKVKAGEVGMACKTCHSVHREQLPDKTFRLKTKA
jgi:cytochrome c556